MRTGKIFFILLVATTISAQTNNWNEQVQLARTLEQSGEYEKASAIFKALLNAQPENEIFFQGLNRNYIQTKNYTASIDLIEGRIKKQPDNFTAYGLLGSTYYAMDNRDRAFEIWDDGIAIHPTSPTVYRTIANFMIESRAIDRAIELLLRGRDKLRQPDLYAFDLANLYTSMMKFKEAALEFCNILLNQGSQLNTIKARMNNYLYRGDAMEVTLNVVSEFCDENPSPILYQLAGFLFENIGDFNKAFQYIKQSDDLTENDTTILFNFAKNALVKSEYEIAAKAFELIITKHPNTPHFQPSKIGYVHALQLKLDMANENQNDAWKPIRRVSRTQLNEYQKIIDLYNDICLKSNSPELRSESFFNIGMIFKDRFKNYNAADSMFQIIVTHYPATQVASNAFLELGKISILQGNYKKAKNYLTSEAQVPTNNSDIIMEMKFYYAKTQFWQNKFDKAAALLAQSTGDLFSKHANDAIELSVVISTFKNDSTSLSQYAAADLLIEQKLLPDAVEILNVLSESKGGTMLGELAKFRLAQILITQDELPSAVALLEDIAESDISNVFNDKALYLLAQVYQFGIMDKIKAIKFYEKLLATFPNSLYLDNARENINFLQPKY